MFDLKTSLGVAGIGLILSNLFPLLLLAQTKVPLNPTIPVPSKTPVMEDLPNNTQQMRTWTCHQEKSTILVEAKDITTWPSIIQSNGWQCREQLSIIPDNAPTFSCESDESKINLITTTWLKGDGGQEQMKAWLKAFQAQNMTCTMDKTNPFWN